MPGYDLFRQSLKTNTIQEFLNSFNINSKDKWFISISRSIPWGNDSDSPTTSVDSVFDENEFLRYCIAHKRIKPSDVSLVIRRIDWERGTVYSSYRDNLDLYNDSTPSNFYVLVDEERVYKCIDNNFDSPSSYTPTHTDSDIKIYPDGYRWKFLYTIPESKRKFLTKQTGEKPGYMPVEFVDRLKENDDRTLQWNVQNSAVSGAIDYISLNKQVRDVVIANDKVVHPSINNSVIGPTASGSSTIIIGGTSIVKQNDFYNNMVLRIDTGLGSGQQRVIKDYTINPDSTALVQLENPLNIGVTGGTGSDCSKFSIYPNIKIVGDGQAQPNPLNTYSDSAEVTVKFLTTNVTGQNFLDSIELINRGKNYTFAELDIIEGLTTVSGSTYTLDSLGTPVISPFGGNGSNPVEELGASSLMIVVNINQDENNKLKTENDYRQIGLTKNIELYNKKIKISFLENGITSSFTVGSIIEQGLTGIGGQTGFTNSFGKVVSWYPGSPGISASSELILENITGDFRSNGKIGSFSIFDVTPVNILGEESRNLVKLNIVPIGSTSSTFNPSGTDFYRGQRILSYSNTADSISSMYRAGKVYKWQPDMGTNSSGYLLLEGVEKDYFKEGELLYKFDSLMKSLTGPNAKVVFSEEEYETSNLVYNQTVEIKLNSSGLLNHFSENTFSNDNFIMGMSGSTKLSSGYLIDWTPSTGGTNGNMVLSGVQGQFSTTQTIEYNYSGITYSGTISSIINNPDARYRTGKVLHIQNLRPIERVLEQQEEIKLIVEF